MVRGGTDRSRSRFEATLRDLRGRRLTSVDYWDVHNLGADPVPWDYGDWHHAVMACSWAPTSDR